MGQWWRVYRWKFQNSELKCTVEVSEGGVGERTTLTEPGWRAFWWMILLILMQDIRKGREGSGWAGTKRQGLVAESGDERYALLSLQPVNQPLIWQRLTAFSLLPRAGGTPSLNRLHRFTCVIFAFLPLTATLIRIHIFISSFLYLFMLYQLYLVAYLKKSIYLVFFVNVF